MLVGADVFRVLERRNSGGTIRREKHLLPHPAMPGDTPHYDLDSGILLHSPDWGQNASLNHIFIDAVVDAVVMVNMSSFLLINSYLLTNYASIRPRRPTVLICAPLRRLCAHTLVPW